MHSSLCAGRDAGGVMERYWKNSAVLDVGLDPARYTDEMNSAESLRLVLRNHPRGSAPAGEASVLINVSG